MNYTGKINNLKEKDWVVELQIDSFTEEYNGHNFDKVAFFMLLVNNKEFVKLKKYGFKYQSDLEIKHYKIGMDSACIALGINENANEINESYNEWQPSCSIRTGTDGMFGDVSECKDKNGNLCFLFISGEFNGNLIDEDTLLNYLKNQFEIQDLKIKNIKKEMKVSLD